MKSKSSNRSFGILFFVVFFIIALWPLKSGGNINFYSLALSIIFLSLGIINSKLLSPLNNLWVKLGEILGQIIAPIVMAIIYFAILTPISLLVRLLGKDLLNLEFNKKKESYWIKRKKAIGAMRKQF